MNQTPSESLGQLLELRYQQSVFNTQLLELARLGVVDVIQHQVLPDPTSTTHRNCSQTQQPTFATVSISVEEMEQLSATTQQQREPENMKQPSHQRSNVLDDDTILLSSFDFDQNEILDYFRENELQQQQYQPQQNLQTTYQLPQQSQYPQQQQITTIFSSDNRSNAVQPAVQPQPQRNNKRAFWQYHSEDRTNISNNCENPAKFRKLNNSNMGVVNQKSTSSSQSEPRALFVTNPPPTTTVVNNNEIIRGSMIPKVRRMRQSYLEEGAVESTIQVNNSKYKLTDVTQKFGSGVMAKQNKRQPDDKWRFFQYTPDRVGNVQ